MKAGCEEDQVFTYTFMWQEDRVFQDYAQEKGPSEIESKLELFYADGANILSREGGKVTVLVISSGA